MDTADELDVTGLLLRWNDGQEAARDQLMSVVYHELRRVARRHLRAERPEHTLEPTALVHETYVKLVDQRRVRWQNRAHFFAMAARLMRRLLVDHARSRAAAKRGNAVTIPLDSGDTEAAPPDGDVLALNEALDKLAAHDGRQSRIVELRFFAGLTVEETAEALDIASATQTPRQSGSAANCFTRASLVQAIHERTVPSRGAGRSAPPAIRASSATYRSAVRGPGPQADDCRDDDGTNGVGRVHAAPPREDA